MYSSTHCEAWPSGIFIGGYLKLYEEMLVRGPPIPLSSPIFTALMTSATTDRKSTRLNHVATSYAGFCLKKKIGLRRPHRPRRVAKSARGCEKSQIKAQYN